MDLTPPDEWATDHGAAPTGVRPWSDDVPDDVRALIAASSASVRDLVSWFHVEVSAAYPDESWPGKATVAKVERLRNEVRA